MHRELHTIWIKADAYSFLTNEQRKQRGCKPLSASQIDARINHIPSFKRQEGLILISDSTFGGGDGTYGGHWTTWDIDTLKSMLNKAGYSYTDGEPIQADFI